MTSKRQFETGRTRWQCAGGRLTLAAVLTLCVTPLRAQSPPLVTEPPAASLLCDVGAPLGTAVAGDAAAPDASRLVSQATQAMSLGDLSVVLDYLDQALEADPEAADAVYLRGRMTAQVDGLAAAVPWLCRYLELAPAGPSAAETERLLEEALTDGAGAAVATAFHDGVDRFEAGDLAGSEERFSTVIGRRPVPEALYNRAVVRVALDRTAAARSDVDRLLELQPNAADREEVATLLESLAQQGEPPGAAAAFVLGALFPGGGQYYTGRPGYGFLITAAVAGAVAGGYLYERTTVQCRVIPRDGTCPPGSIAGEETERPYLTAALGVGGAVMLLSAIEAAVRAGGRETAVSVPVGGRASLRLGISARTAPAGTLRISWLSLRH